jgi:hypothetical protein
MVVVVVVVVVVVGATVEGVEPVLGIVAPFVTVVFPVETSFAEPAGATTGLGATVVVGACAATTVVVAAGIVVVDETTVVVLAGTVVVVVGATVVVVGATVVVVGDPKEYVPAVIMRLFVPLLDMETNIDAPAMTVCQEFPDAATPMVQVVPSGEVMTLPFPTATNWLPPGSHVTSLQAVVAMADDTEGTLHVTPSADVMMRLTPAVDTATKTPLPNAMSNALTGRLCVRDHVRPSVETNDREKWDMPTNLLLP